MRQPRTVLPRPALEVIMGPDGLLHVGRGGHVRVDATNFDYAFAVIDDLGIVAAMPDGNAVLAECDALGRRIVIARPDAPPHPPNASVAPDDRQGATARGQTTGQVTADGKPVIGSGAGSASCIRYDPADWPRQGDPTSPQRADLLLALLRQAVTNAKGADIPTDGRTCLPSQG